MGSSRMSQEVKDAAEKRSRSVETARMQELIEAKRRAFEGELEGRRLAFKAEIDSLATEIAEGGRKETVNTASRVAIGRSRWGKEDGGGRSRRRH